MSAETAAPQTADEKEAFHRAAEAKIKPFKYETPADTGRPKDVTSLLRGSLLKVTVQTVRDGGENNLHYHTKSETAWMVLSGRVRFYGVGDALLGEFGPHEGIFLPGGARYWFEKTGPDDLELLQMVGIDRTGDGKAARINVDAHKDWMSDSAYLQVYEETPA
jgi:mannose-6-phosphate isomerase-like protein (cupin superfamily)